MPACSGGFEGIHRTGEAARNEANGSRDDRSNDQKKAAAAIVEAEKAAVEQESKVQEITLGKVFDDYLQSRKLEDNTGYIYKSTVRSTLSDWLDLSLTEIKKDMVERHDHAMRILRALFTYAKITYEHPNGDPIITNNLVTRLSQARIWNKKARRQTVIKSHELSAWCKAVMGLENKTVIDYLLLLLFTGLRKNEAAELLWENVDLTGATLLIPVPKNRQPHMLPLTPFLKEMLQGTMNMSFPGRVKSIDTSAMCGTTWI